MTLYELTNSTTIQGDIEVALIDENGNDVRRVRLGRVDDLAHELFRDLYGLEDRNVKYIFPRIIDGDPCIIIELTTEGDE